MGAITAIEQHGSAHESQRGAPDIERSEQHSFHLLMSLGGAWDFRHRGRVKMQCGDVVLVDSNLSYEIRLLDEYHFMHMKLTPAWLRTWVADTDALVGRRISTSSASGRALSQFLTQLTPETVEHGVLPTHLMADQVGALLAMTAWEKEKKAAQDPRLFSRIRDAIAERASVSDLSAEAIAAELSIPVDRVHATLGANGTTLLTVFHAHRLRQRSAKKKN
jgi:hypothetical protein